MATTATDAEAMVRCAQENAAQLYIGNICRHYWTSTSMKVSVGSPYRNLLKQKENSLIDERFARLLSMKAQGYPILNSAEHRKEIAKYLKESTSPAIIEKVCKVGIKNLNIDPFGSVRLCSIMGIVGNITEADPAEIWRSANAAHQREEIVACDKVCRLMFCNYKQLDLKYKLKRVVAAMAGYWLRDFRVSRAPA
jgi:hypothetical protein